MKKNLIYKLFSVLVLSAVLIAACTKDQDEVKLEPQLSTSQYTDLKSDSVIVVGFVVASGNGFSERGVCYSTDPAPTVDDNKVVYSGDTTTATFKVKLHVDRLTKYYVRAYVVNASGVLYGEEYSFTTPAAVPSLAGITAPVIETTTDKGITASTAINITDDGGPHTTAEITERGVVYGTTAVPTLDSLNAKIAANKTIKTTEGTGSGEYTSFVSNLKGNVTYYLRAYATNSIGTTYSNVISFNTETGYPQIVTNAVSEITDVAGKLNGDVKYDGGAPITERGFVYGTTPNPTLENGTVVTDAKDTIGVFSKTITGLTKGTKYYVRAYASNGTYTNYGAEVNFTPMYPTSLYMIGNGVGSWTWSETDLPMIPVNGQPHLFWKIVWMKGSGDFKFAPQRDWIGDFGKTGTATDNVFDKGTQDIPVPQTPGYYMVVVDLAAGKIAIADPKVYLIGNTVGSWDTSNPSALFTVDNANEVISITKDLAADEIRMYAWHPWFTDWWRSEFIVLNNKIEFRGTGGDQTRVPVAAGSRTVKLNFKTGAGSIE